ncbi:hypothetical protein LINGRAHAP2_LOCUS31003 [Linum grandiflorum]
MSNCCYAVRFSSKEDYLKAAFGGPWKIFDYYIVVSIWTPDFNVNQPIRKILTWIQLLDLPLHYFNDLAVSRIAGYVGTAVRVDVATANGECARYARACVEIDLSRPLLRKYELASAKFKVVYESLENL